MSWRRACCCVPSEACVSLCRSRTILRGTLVSNISLNWRVHAPIASDVPVSPGCWAHGGGRKGKAVWESCRWISVVFVIEIGVSFQFFGLIPWYLVLSFVHVWGVVVRSVSVHVLLGVVCVRRGGHAVHVGVARGEGCRVRCGTVVSSLSGAVSLAWRSCAGSALIVASLGSIERPGGGVAGPAAVAAVETGPLVRSVAEGRVCRAQSSSCGRVVWCVQCMACVECRVSCSGRGKKEEGRERRAYSVLNTSPATKIRVRDQGLPRSAGNAPRRHDCPVPRARTPVTLSTDCGALRVAFQARCCCRRLA